MYKILTLNNISVSGLERLPRDRYEIASEIQHPDADLGLGSRGLRQAKRKHAGKQGSERSAW